MKGKVVTDITIAVGAKKMESGVFSINAHFVDRE